MHPWIPPGSATALLPSGAVVGLDKTEYQVSEDVGVVEVCAIVHTPNITCPIEFTFHINLSTSDESAGIHFQCVEIKNLYLL